MPNTCSIRKLRIHAPQKYRIPVSQTVFLVEDGFRQASFLGMPAYGELIIKKIQVSVPAGKVTSQSISNKINQKVQAINLIKIDENNAEYPSASAVWFEDECKPYSILAAMLAKNHYPQSWYWTNVLPGWKKHFTLLESFLYIANSLMHLPQGLKGLSPILEIFAQEKKLQSVMEQVKERHIHSWISLYSSHTKMDISIFNEKEYQISGKKQISFSPPVLPTLSQLQQNILTELYVQWGHSSLQWRFVTVVILADSILSITKPILHQVEQELILKYNLKSENDIQVEGHKQLSRKGKEARKSKTGQNPEIEDMIKVSTQSQESNQSLLLSGKPAKDRSDSHTQVLHQLQAPISMTSQSYSRKEEEEKSKSLGNEDKPSTKPSEQSFYAPDKPIWQGRFNAISPFGGTISSHVGLACIVNLLNRLGIRETLATFPELDNLQLPRLILYRIAHLMEIPRDDPITALFAFPGYMDIPNQELQYCAPRAWFAYLVNKKRLFICRNRNCKGLRHLYEVHAKYPLAYMFFDQLKERKESFASYTIIRALPFQRSLYLSDIIDAWVRGIMMYLHRYSKLTLKSLVTYQGNIAVTKTHCDITIPMKAIRIEIRSCGLDIDPGWIEWLGRVIMFHYTDTKE